MSETTVTHGRVPTVLAGPTVAAFLKLGRVRVLPSRAGIVAGRHADVVTPGYRTVHRIDREKLTGGDYEGKEEKAAEVLHREYCSGLTESMERTANTNYL